MNVRTCTYIYRGILLFWMYILLQDGDVAALKASCEEKDRIIEQLRAECEALRQDVHARIAELSTFSVRATGDGAPLEGMEREEMEVRQGVDQLSHTTDIPTPPPSNVFHRSWCVRTTPC